MPTTRQLLNWKNLGLALAFMVGVGLFSATGSYLGSLASQPASDAKFEFPMELKAATGSRTDTLSMATGLIDGNVEGLWILDHKSGNLQCWMMNARTGTVGAIYQSNIINDIGGKVGQMELMMVTGNFFWDGGNNANLTPGQTICYVGDAKTGNVVGYGMLYNRQDIKRGNVQGGPLRLVCQGKARIEQVDREQ